jgi:hypothetical protein
MGPGNGKIREDKMSKWVAVDCIDEAIDRTKRLLTPFRLGFWMKLALVVLLVSGGGGNGGGGGSSGSDKSSSSGSFTSYATSLPAIDAASASAFGGNNDPFSDFGLGLGVLLVIFVFIAMFVLVFMYLSSISQFVYVKALVSGDLRLLEYYRSQAENGLRLFFLDLASLVFIIAFVVAGVLAGIWVYGMEASTILKIMLFVVGLAGFVFVIVVASILLWLVTEFVVPVMYASGCGLFEGVRKVKSLVESGYSQFGVFLLLKLVLGACGWGVRFIVSFVFMLPLIFVLLLVGIGAGVTGVSSDITDLAFVAMIPVFIAVGYVVILVTLPVSVFLRYYGIVFLQRMDPKLDLSGPKNIIRQADVASSSDENKVRVY